MMREDEETVSLQVAGRAAAGPKSRAIGGRSTPPNFTTERLALC